MCRDIKELLKVHATFEALPGGVEPASVTDELLDRVCSGEGAQGLQRKLELFVVCGNLVAAVGIWISL